MANTPHNQQLIISGLKNVLFSIEKCKIFDMMRFFTRGLFLQLWKESQVLMPCNTQDVFHPGESLGQRSLHFLGSQ